MAKPKRKTKIKTRPYDSAEYLDTPEAIAEYLTDALEDDDPRFIAKAIGTAARARGMSEIAREAGVSRENLYRALSGDTKPEFDTIRRVLDALGVRLEVRPKAA
jgi:probable addiction module antidote protein